MSFFVTGLTSVVHLDDENTVTIRKQSTAVRQNTLSKSTRMVVGAQQDMSIDIGVMRLELLRNSIVSWDGPGFEGVAVSNAFIDALDPAIADKILTAIDEFNAPLTDDEKKA